MTRLIDPILESFLEALPAVMLVGPRAAGKTTTARRVAASTLRLDRPASADAVRIDPDAALAAYDEPVVVDEWQLVPEVLGAIKRTIDDDSHPARFVLTGSLGADLTAAGWPATGRVIRLPLWGFTERELEGDPHAAPFLDRLLADGLTGVTLPVEMPDVRGYVERALRGSYPEVARQPSERVRRGWLASYIDQLVTRDVALAGIRRDPVRLRRYLRAVAANTAGITEHKTIYDAASVNRLTGVAYDDLLEALFVTEHVPAWASSHLGRLVGLPKRYLTDAALMGPLLGVDVRAVVRDANLLGRVIDTYVTAQLRAELAISDEAPRFFHIRDPHGRHEIDLIAETADGRVLAFEIKANASPPPDAARHLTWLRDRLGDRFALGVVFHTGPAALRIADRVVALPICSVWG